MNQPEITCTPPERDREQRVCSSCARVWSSRSWLFWNRRERETEKEPRAKTDTVKYIVTIIFLYAPPFIHLPRRVVYRSDLQLFLLVNEHVTFSVILTAEFDSDRFGRCLLRK